MGSGAGEGDLTPHYVIRGGVAGRERLRVLARVMWPTTRALLRRVGIDRRARCLDVGCGGGDVTLELARLAADGDVVGLDLDETKLEMARKDAANVGLANVEFRSEDVTTPSATDERFDLIYVRFLLTHLPNPDAVLTNLVGRLRPRGTMILEDIDFTGHFCEPPSDAFERYLDVYTSVARARGCDPHIGRRLPGMLRDVGIPPLGMNVVQPAGFDGEVKLIAPITLEAVSDALLESGITDEQTLGETIGALYAFAREEGTIMSLPRVVQTWGVITTN